MSVAQFFYPLFALFVLTAPTLALADQDPSAPLPAQKLVTYRIHDDPNDPNGSVDYEIALWLTEQARQDQEIRWSVEKVTVRRPGIDGGSDMVWTDLTPRVDTASGDWSVTHADLDNPVSEDFVLPPQIFGTAVDEAAIAANLKYSFSGSSSVPPGPFSWADSTAALQWQFVLEGESTSLDEGEDEPVELPPIGDPPHGN